jgi:hypothetical protein
MTQTVTYLTPEDAAMWAAAGLAQLPRVPFPQVKVIVEPAGEMPLAPLRGDGTAAGPTMPCRCGCGEPVAQARIGRPSLYASGACRMRALRSRQRASVGS